MEPDLVRINGKLAEDPDTVGNRLGRTVKGLGFSGQDTNKVFRSDNSILGKEDPLRRSWCRTL